MDVSLRCNSLKCRTELTDTAVVTTCSHIFCVACSEHLGLANPDAAARVCPACQTQLANPDDAVVTQLNPTEDYKTSVLSGLSPSVVMECAGRGLGFWSYQTTQEIVYQEYLAKSLTDKYSALSSQMDKVIHDANTEITSLRDKMAGMQLELTAQEKKNEDLAAAFREKSQTQQKLQKMYTALKQRQLASGMELAAENDAEHVLQGIGHYGRNDQHSRTASGGSGGRSRAIDAWESQHQHAGLATAFRAAPIPSTPSGHRSRLPMYGLNGTATSKIPENDHGRPGRATPRHHRPALNSLDPNVYGNSNTTGYGMSAGVKVGRQQQGGPLSRSGMGLGGFGMR